VQAQDDYVCFHASGKQYLKEQPLAEVEASLNQARFVRIHRSYLLNVDRLARVEPLTKDSRLAILKDGRKLPLSRAGFQRLNALL
jgi:two-component system, LytTR family, response regulator